jgi:hypothetical protein
LTGAFLLNRKERRAQRLHLNSLRLLSLCGLKFTMNKKAPISAFSLFLLQFLSQFLHMLHFHFRVFDRMENIGIFFNDFSGVRVQTMFPPPLPLSVSQRI